MTVINTVDPQVSAFTPAADQTIIIAPGIERITLGTVFTGALLINYGRLMTVNFGPSSSGEFVNQAGGAVVYDSGSAVIVGTAATIVNDGVILGGGAHGISLEGAANNDSITNRGDIYGLLGGITVSSGAALNIRITNSGEILSDGNGIWLLNANAAPVVINSGVIKGRTNSIYATAGDKLNVTNSGTLNGNVKGDTTNGIDKLVNNGTVIGNVLLGSGNDLYSGTGIVTGTVFGEAGNDVLSGGKSADRLNGGTQNDTLTGRLGVDSLTGGTGNDFFVFRTPVLAANRDYIADYGNVTGNNDTMRLENAYFTKLGGPGALNGQFFRNGTVALDANDHLIYNKATGVLNYDTNGNLAGGVTQIAQFTLVKPILTAADFVVI